MFEKRRPFIGFPVVHRMAGRVLPVTVADGFRETGA
jgi:hypothetical protein